MSIENDDLIADFVIESNEHLADVENQLLAIEAAGSHIDVELVNTVFRAIHSIKGAAAFLGLQSINQLSHSLENVLNLIRGNELVPTTENVDVMLRAADVLGGLISDTHHSNDVDVSAEVKALDAIASPIENSAANEDLGAPIHGPTESIDAKSSQSDVPLQTTSGETSVVAGEPAVPGNVGVTEDGATSDDAQETSKFAFPAFAADTAKESGKPSDVETKPKSSSNPESDPSGATSKGASGPLTSAETSIRVPVGVLDVLMNLAGELVLSRNQLLQVLASNEKSGLESVAAGLDQVTSELQDAIMQTRMQPIGIVFSRFSRVVRDLSSKLGRKCELQIEGKDVEVDKTIIEAIGDPLTHLVRNSVDHGIELPDARLKNGKPATGMLLLRAFHQAGKVMIQIRDDGAGIDPEKLKLKAVSRGLLTIDQAEKMSNRDAARLIFHAGFSMAKEVTDVSGRGVGMDVVRTNVERLGGSVDIESELGQGTTILLTLPLTLAIIPSMIIQCRNDRFAIPQVNIVELVRVRRNEIAKRIGRVKDAEVLRLRGNLLPLIRLDDSLKLNTSPDEEDGTDENANTATNIIVVESGQLRYGLVVDSICDSEEIVVKPLGRHLKQCSYLAGATILGDGHVALILDVAGIAAESALHMQQDDQSDLSHNEDELQGYEEAQTVLLFQNNPHEQFAIPMSVVARLERIRKDQIDSIGGHTLLQYRGSSLPLLRLEEHIQAEPCPDVERVYVIVFRAGDHEVGLLAPQLEDIRDISTHVDTRTFREKGVAGSLVDDGRTIRILNLFELAELANPEWFIHRRVDEASQERQRTVLLAEDSKFFRHQVTGYFKDAGYDVVEAEDGEEAWNLLKSGEHEIDAVVTDIEMPNLNGFQLCQRIRDDAQLADMIVIALTSLASDDNIQYGKDVGLDEYQVKMDRERLLDSVASQLAVKTRQTKQAQKQEV